ncbi:MAG TPA: pentapeptide repeat-containing protein, partial [Blastocatellia bacterium]|nr:pentapeptide repeat-containing protein [Blastocatellia bacterium]
DSGRQGALAALQIHAKYQRDQYLSEPLFKREPYALQHIYVNTECGKLKWGEIRGPRDARRGEDFMRPAQRCDPFSENHGGRHNLLDTAMGFITDRNFKEPIVIQGVAGAGKSSFTLRLCSELWAKGFQPLRIRLKRLRLSSSLIDALNEAVELTDEDRLADLPIARPKDLLLGGEIFRTPYGGDHALCRYVLIFDGWDELDLSDSRPFREKVGEMLREVRRVFLDPQRTPRVRVIITGRPSPDVVESKFLNDDTPVLTMRSIRPWQLREFVERLDDALGSVPPYIAVENPDEWRVPHQHTLDKAFGKYEETFNASLPKYDEDGNIKETGRAPDSNSLEVLGLPLLAYLTIRVMAQMVKSSDPLEKQQSAINEMVENPTLLYRSLTDLTCEKAGKAAFDDRDCGDEVERQWREVGWKLRERLRRTAAAMSTLGVEHISREEWKRRALQDEKEERETQTAEDHPLTRLMISFYFKGGQPEQGCEFAHKSFREYLFAERIVETLKEYGRNLSEREAERLPERDYWRDFSREEDRPRYEFSREMAYLLAPQWVAPNVWGHLQHLIEWEISRAATASNAAPNNRQLTGLPTQALSFERWKYVRDGLADLWEWWCDCAHLRPQVKTDRWEKSKIEPPFVEKLIRWAAPLTAEENEALKLDSSTSIDAHLGDALCQICAMVHFYIAVNEGLKQIEPGRLEYLKSDRKYQRLANRDQIKLVLFAPGGEDIKGPFNPTFRHYCARINSAFGGPLREFPSRAILDGVYLDGAALSLSTIIDAHLTFANLCRANLEGSNLNGASLNGTDLIGANLAFASLIGASLSGANLNSASLEGTVLNGAVLRTAVGLTPWQIESAWINEWTTLPEDLLQVKPEILERQRSLLERA